MWEVTKRGERVFLIGIKTLDLTREEAEESLKELKKLAESARGEVISELLQHIKTPSSSTLIGKGKVLEIKEKIAADTIDLVIFDSELSPSQQRNLEKEWDIKVIDRTGIILDIFGQRAHSKEGKLQVELAQLSYLLPRLRGKGLELSRLGGGIGSRGPGETDLEYNLRSIRSRIVKIKRDLEKVRKTRTLHRVHRKSPSVLNCSLVGYTNAGKSTLLNTLAKADVFVEDRLFSTLDTTTRKVILPQGRVMFLSDTVGFIRRIPYQLISAFKATLEELKEAQILLHVVDVSDNQAEDRIQSVLKVLKELGLEESTLITIFNKIDLLEDRRILKSLQKRFQPSVAISSLNGEGIKSLLTMIENMFPLFLAKRPLHKETQPFISN